MSRSGIERIWRALGVAALVLGVGQTAWAGQLGALMSPGPLAKAHASLEGGANCSKCHEAGRKVTAARCLICHQPVAERIARKTGVHRNVTNDCATCHHEHAGSDVDLRQVDTRTFDHVAETGFPLDALHAKTAAKCEACHKSRTFLNAKTACASCHADAHKGQLGQDCTKCHSTKVNFKSAAGQFNHTTARFVLTGAHQKVACAKCHKAATYRGVAFESCTDCHQTPHRKTLGPSCTTCHTTEQWVTRTVDHAKTAFPLAGLHAQVVCVKCHPATITRALRFDQCAACHANPHKNSLDNDCRACHTEKSFRGGKFEHATRTAFPLEGKHNGLECRKCHTTVSAPDVPLARKVVDYKGARNECAACHADPHKGTYGVTCDGCHGPATFDTKNFTHPRSPDFFAERHAGVACAKCHTHTAVLALMRSWVPLDPSRSTTSTASTTSPASRTSPSLAASPSLTASPLKASPSSTASPSMACASCHADVHFGQVGDTCDRCHSIGGEKFAAVRFAHTESRFPLTGKHEQPLECVKCHKTEARAFPAGVGSAVQFHPASECLTCHTDAHLGQVGVACESCHSTAAFKIEKYTHLGLQQFFAGFHGRYECASCHKKETRAFPAGMGTAVRFIVGRECAACHNQH